MVRVNINILGISELKWTGMGEFNSDHHYIYYCRQESLRRNGVAIMVNKRVQNEVQFSSVAQSCLTLCDSMNCSMPGFPVHPQLGIVFALAPYLHSFWSYFTTDLQ